MVGNGQNVVKIGAVCLISYIIGIGLSPHILPIDFLTGYLAPFLPAETPNNASSKLIEHKAPTAPGSAPSVTTSPKQPEQSLPQKPEKSLPQHQPPPTEPLSEHATDYKRIVGIGIEGDDPFNGVDIIVHRNGEPDPCARQLAPLHHSRSNDGAPASTTDDLGQILSSASKALLHASDLLFEGNEKKLDDYQKYDLDAILTHALAVGSGPKSSDPASGAGPNSLLEDRGSTCGPTWQGGKHFLDVIPWASPMLRFCDMGHDRTPIQPDHTLMVRVPMSQSLPCHFHTREGVRITSLEQLARCAWEAKVPVEVCAEEELNADGTCATNIDGDGGNQRRELHLYAVPAGRVFIFAPKYVGEIFELPHVKVPQNLPVWLEVISLKPRVFDIYNFFDREESAAIVDKALKETSDTHRIKRSSTGASGYNVNSQRTSENGFDTHGKEAQAVKHRCMDVLGFDTYIESFTDGLQVLRYNKTTAYVPHLGE